MDNSIIRTLTYFDIFDFPLTLSEIKKYSDTEFDVTDEQLRELIDEISTIQETEGFYYLLGRHDIVEKRIERGSISIEKFAKAKIIAKLLFFIPTIKYIGVSGSLSMNNSSISDDIDLFFITKKNSLWLTRLIVTSILYFSKQKRGRDGNDHADKICPNMFMDATKLKFPNKRKTLYTAHEIVQLKTLYERNEMHSKFLLRNKWISEFFPNYSFPKVSPVRKKNAIVKMAKRIVMALLIPFEKASYIAQKFYIDKHRSREVVAKDRAFFHPVDRQKLIMDMHRLRNKRFQALHTDNLWVDKEEARFYMEEKKIRILN